MKNAGLDFNIDFPSSACKIMIDENAYTCIINNLIQNVISHSHASFIEIIMHKAEHHIEISICDMVLESAKKIYSMFLSDCINVIKEGPVKGAVWDFPLQSS